jgi:hypothetical protein
MATVWFILLMSGSGHAIELPVRYDTEKECVAAAVELMNAHPGSSARCVPKDIAAPR